MVRELAAGGAITAELAGITSTCWSELCGIILYCAACAHPGSGKASTESAPQTFQPPELREAQRVEKASDPASQTADQDMGVSRTRAEFLTLVQGEMTGYIQSHEFWKEFL